MSASLATIMMLTGCSKPQETTTLNIGFQKYGVLPIIKARGDLDKALKEKGVNVKWVEFPAGPQLLEGLNVGSVAFGESGEAPPIFAQAANSNLVYVANQPAAPLAEALIVPKDSAIQSVQDLKGKRVVLNKGSNVHYLLLKVLEANHLKLDDIQVVYLPPADARAAFEKGAVDAWVIWDPFFAAAEKQLNAKVIATGQNLVNNHQFYLADPSRFNATTHAMTTMLICSAMLGSASVWAIDPTVKELRIGFQKSSINFAIAKQQKLYEKEFPNAKITWNEFPAGPQILEALAVGSLDVGVTGDTPPVYAQAANKPLYYIAYEAAKPLASAILVPKDSKITKLNELKGKRIALQKGSSAHYLLVQAVRKAGLQWSDIQPIWLTPADARAAFQKGAVDAWAIWDPFFASAQVEDQARILASGQGLSPNYTFYLASPDFVKKYPQAIKGIIQQINTADKWVQANRVATAQAIGQSTGLKPKVSQTFIERRPRLSGAAPLSAKVIADQQQLANRFSELKIIPNSIDIKQAVWTAK
ncbi:hypothetical protein CRE_10783 [Caenorhabditis remanei]|uniref:Solute-binding protein family 3/N-terminal domain-containing protein n=1 Tax=Caenorhabditis remanei TaxID=31234 RepID=E3NVB3_CAERE|nr:hypothetical protein CRE_10783 [Caenorhabditis remanei]